METLRLLWGSVVHRPYVFAFLACFAAFALRQLGWKRALTFALPTFALAYAAEWSSTRNGFPFGPYAYDETTRTRELWLSNVPSWDTASFVFLSYFSLVVAAAVRTPRAARAAAPWPALRAPGTALLGGLLMTLLDVVIDPVTLQGERWFLGRIYAYPWRGLWFGVTAANFAGWFLVGAATQWTFQRLLALPWCRDPWRPVGPRFAWAALGVYAGVLGFMLAVTISLGDWPLLAASGAVSAATLAALARGLRGPRRAPVVICAATTAEALACRAGLAGVRGVEVLRTGVGPRRAAAALAGRLAELPRPTLVVSSGFAGALGPGPVRHQPVTARELLAWPGEAPPRGGLRLAPGAAPCALLPAAAVVRVGGAGPFTIVDMESHALARLAAAAGIPFGVLRVVSDTPAAPFPPFVRPLGLALSQRRLLPGLVHGARALAGALRRPAVARAFLGASLAARRALRQAWRARAGTVAAPSAPAWRAVALAIFLLLPLAAARPAVAAPPAAAAPIALVACAPGYPGTTAEAQPGLDALAAALARGAGWGAGAVAGVYLPAEEDGLARLARPDAAVALVPAPFFAEHAAALKLVPRLAAVGPGGGPGQGPGEVWTLVAGRGRVGAPAALAGFTLLSTAGYAPGFVRAALRGWGTLPPGVKIAASGQVLSALRRAAAGEPVAVLLDGPQGAALEGLPFAPALEVVARSAALPRALVVTVGGRLPEARWRQLQPAFLDLARAPGGAEVLAGLQLSAFAALDAPARAELERLAAEAGR